MAVTLLSLGIHQLYKIESAKKAKKTSRDISVGQTSRLTQGGRFPLGSDCCHIMSLRLSRDSSHSSEHGRTL
jgi:hypothetical protein